MTTKEALDFLVAEADRQGGFIQWGTGALHVSLKAGDQLALVRLGANGQGEILLPATLTRGITMGSVIAGAFLIREEAQAEPPRIILGQA